MRGLLEPDSPIDGSARGLEFIGYLGVTEIRMGKVHRRRNARGNVPTSVSPAYLQKKRPASLSESQDCLLAIGSKPETPI